MADDLGNLDIQKQINELLSDRSGIYAKHSEMLKGQAQLALNVAELLGRDTSGYRTSIEEASTALDAAADAAERAAAGTEGMGGSAAKAGKEVEKTSNTIIKFGNIAKKTFGWFKNTIGAIVEIVATLRTAIFGIAGAILKTPLKILGVFQEQARKLAEDSLALREAFEEIRDKFGDLSSNEGKSVTDAFKNMRAESGNLAGSGRSLSSVFGYGPQGLAAALKYAGEVASALGPTLNTLGQQFEDNAASITMMAKGLDLSNEAIGALGTQAKARGEDLNDSFKEIGNLSVQMGKKFGISSKEMGRSMSYMTANMGKFGSMTKAQMATAAVYTKKLGLEIKDLEGVMGAFDDFETAATNASKLSQAFGMNVDAMEMMKEQDPAKRLDMLRKAFAATGKSIESMSRQEKAMLAQTAGLPENMVEASLSAKNMGLSYEEVAAAAEGAADKQLTQEEIMQDMAKNIKKVFAPLQYVAGLLENFMNGFVTGIMRSKPAMALLQAIMRVIQKLYQVGLDLGGIFVDVFPGIKEMFQGTTDYFNNFYSSIEKIRKAILSFFHGLKDDPVKATQEFMGKIQKIFFDKFDPKAGGAKFFGGLKTFGLTIAKIFLGFGKWFLDALQDGIKEVVNYLKNLNKDNAVVDGVKEGFGKLTKLISENLSYFVKDIAEFLGEILPDVFAAIENVAKLLVKEISNYFESTSSVEILKQGLIGLIVTASAGLLGSYGAVAGLIGAGLLVALSASDIDEKIGPELEKKFTGNEVNKSASAAGAKMAISILDAFTLGLLSDDALISVGTFMMNFYDRFLTEIEKISPMWASAVRDGLTGAFEIFSGIGDVLKGLIEGDGDKVAKGFKKMIMGSINSIKSSTKYMLAIFHDLIPKVIDGLAKLGKIIMRGIGTLIRGLIIAIKDGLLEAKDFLVNFWNDENFRNEVLKSIASFLVSTGSYIKETMYNIFASIGGLLVDLVVGFIDGLFGTSLLGDKSGREWIDEMVQLGQNLLDGLFENFSIANVAEKMGNIFDAAIEKGKKTLRIGSPSKVMEEMGGNVSDGFENGIKDIPDKFDASAVEAVNKFSETMKTIDSEGLDKGLKVFSKIQELVEMISDVSKSLGSTIVKNLGKNLDKISIAADVFSNFKWDEAFRKLNDALLKIDSKALESMSSKSDGLSGLLKNISDISNVLSKLNVASLSKMQIVIDSFSNNLPVIDSLNAQKVEAASANLSYYSSQVQTIVEDIRQINEAITEINNIKIKSTIAKNAGEIGLKDTVISLESKPIQMNVQLNLTMKAEDIAKEIFDVAYKTVYPGEGTSTATAGMTEAYRGSSPPPK